MTATAPLPTHEQGLVVFEQVIAELERVGFSRLRVDTLQHYTDANAPEKADRWTVRHHFTHGEWELFYEPDQGWNRRKHPDARLVRIRLDRPLWTAEAVISELFGGKIGRYFPAGAAAAGIPAQRRRPPRSLTRRTAAQ